MVPRYCLLPAVQIYAFLAALMSYLSCNLLTLFLLFHRYLSQQIALFLLSIQRVGAETREVARRLARRRGSVNGQDCEGVGKEQTARTRQRIT